MRFATLWTEKCLFLIFLYMNCLFFRNFAKDEIHIDISDCLAQVIKDLRGGRGKGFGPYGV